MDVISIEINKRAAKYPEQERFGEALNLLLTSDEDKKELIRLIDAGAFAGSGEIIRAAVEMQEARDARGEGR